LGGQSTQGVAGAPEMTGLVLSIVIDTGIELDRPAPFVAEHVKLAPVVSAVKVVPSHPVEEAIPDSGSLTAQVTLTSNQS